MRILQVSRIFPPLLTAQAIAVAKSAAALQEVGAGVHILCGTAFKQFREAPWSFPSPYTETRVSVAGYRLDTVARAFLDSPFAPFFPPTPWALEAARKFSPSSHPENYDVIFATFGPVDSLQAALRIAEQRNLPLVLEFNDPFPYSLQEVLFEDKDYWVRLYRQKYTETWMRALLPRTSLFIVPSSRMKMSLVTYLVARGYAGKPVEVVPHIGWGRDGGPARKANAKVVISHLGSFYSRRKGGKEHFIRSALPFLRALVRVIKEVPDIANSLEVRFVGGLDVPSREFVSRNALENLVVVEPPVDYAASLEKMHEADVLLLLGEEIPASPFLPIKFADYVITRKPMLALCPLDSEVADIMGRRFGVVADIHSLDSMAEQIKHVWRTWMRGALDTLRVPEEISQEFGSKAIGRRYLDAFEIAIRSR